MESVIRKGIAEYTYYKNDDPTVVEALERIRSDAESNELLKIEAYLSGAPSGSRYQDIKQLIS